MLKRLAIPFVIKLYTSVSIFTKTICIRKGFWNQSTVMFSCILSLKTAKKLYRYLQKPPLSSNIPSYGPGELPISLTLFASYLHCKASLKYSTIREDTISQDLSTCMHQVFHGTTLDTVITAKYILLAMWLHCWCVLVN